MISQVQQKILPRFTNLAYVMLKVCSSKNQLGELHIRKQLITQSSMYSRWKYTHNIHIIFLNGVKKVAETSIKLDRHVGTFLSKLSTVKGGLLHAEENPDPIHQQLVVG